MRIYRVSLIPRGSPFAPRLGFGVEGGDSLIYVGTSNTLTSSDAMGWNFPHRRPTLETLNVQPGEFVSTFFARHLGSHDYPFSWSGN
jgi:hypothetical protein